MPTDQGSSMPVHHMVDEMPGAAGQYHAHPATRPASVFGRLGARARELAGPAAGPVIFACVCLALLYSRNRKRAAAARQAATEEAAARGPSLPWSVSFALLRGGDMVLQRMLAMSLMDTQQAVDTMKQLLTEQRIDFDRLNRVAAVVEMSKKEDEAIALLKEAWTKAKSKPHEAYELEMLLVEMLIYKGSLEEALKCSCLQDQDILDARVPLFKAVIYNIKGEESTAKAHYEEFQRIRSYFFDPETPPPREWSEFYSLLHDFDTFKKITNNLKKQIQAAHHKIQN